LGIVFIFARFISYQGLHVYGQTLMNYLLETRIISDHDVSFDIRVGQNHCTLILVYVYYIFALTL